MGITGLIQWVDVCMEAGTVQKLQGKTVAVDSYWLLHKGSYSCSDKLVRGIKTTAMIDYAMKYVKMLQSYCANIIMVFDGRSLPAKKDTEAKRRESREKAKMKAHELAKIGKHSEAKKEFDKAVIITHDYALELMEECRRNDIDCIVAMYEADAQLAFLNKIGLAEYIISEDSDLILFGCKKIVYKLTLDGKCNIFDSDKLSMTFPNFSFEKFRRICILSGCDYVNNLPGIGLTKAKKFMLMTAETDMKKAIPKIPSYMNLKIVVPSDYIENFLRAEATFKYMYVYDPLKKKMVRLNELTDKEDEKYCVNAGELLKPETAYQLALGNINPKTMQRVSNYDPIKYQRSINRPPLQTSYKPLFHLWDYKGKHETAIKIRQQTKITFIPTKFKSKRSEVCDKIAEEENKVEDEIEMDNLISAYCGTDVPNTSKQNNKKRSSSVLNDLDTSTTSSNPFAKRQSLEKNGEKAENVSFIKALSSKSTFEESRVVSRFFKNKTNQEIENPLEIIERIEANKLSMEAEVQERLEENRQFYSTFKNPTNDENSLTKNPLDQIKEKYGKQSSNEDESSQEVYTQSFDIELTMKEILEKDDNEPTTSSKSNENNRLKIKNNTNNKRKKLPAEISLASQYKLTKFGFFKTNRDIL